MRLFTVLAALGVLSFVLVRSGPADDKAQPGAKPGDPNQTKGPHFDAQRFVKDHDKNNDGKLGKDELPADMQDALAEIDTNKDGFITVQELQTHADRMIRQRPQVIDVVFYAIDIPEPQGNSVEELQRTYDLLRKLDKNNDGKIDANEVKVFRETRSKERMDRIFKHMDKNGDGKISKDEARGLWADNFASLDTNKDGSLDRTEVEKALTTAVNNGQPQPQPQPGK
jgi:Ca2+-binding EF-hand superfamily protein